MHPLEPGDPRTIGPYTVLGVLGRGGMGKVYLGQSWAGKRVAIKVIRSDIAGDPVFRQRFVREVEAGRAISALYTAPIVDADPQADTPWLATTYIEGPSLENEVAARGPMSVASVLILAAGLAEAFIAIHRAGLIHRDLKPSNVLLTMDGPCVIDFGIALVPDATSLTLGVIGTPAYMSPEHVSGAEVGPASDIFSIGATLAFAATGAGPLGQGTPHSLIARLMSRQLDIAAVPDELKPVIYRCLAWEAQYRPTATELLGMLASAGAIHPYPGWFAPGTANPAQAGAPIPPPLVASPPAVVAAQGALTPPGAVLPPGAAMPPGRADAPPSPTPPSPGEPARYAPAASPQMPTTRPYRAPVSAPVPGQPLSGQPQPGYASPVRFPAGQASPYPHAGAPYSPGPQIYAPPAATAPRHGLVIALVVLALVIVGSGVATGIALLGSLGDASTGVLRSQEPVFTPTPDQTASAPPLELRLSVPPTLAGLNKSTETELQRTADQAVTDVKRELDGERDAVAAFYDDPAAASKRVLFLGITADITSPVTEIDATFTSFNNTSDVRVGNVADVPAGPLGGRAKCGDGRSRDITIVLCVWGDDESLGMVVFYNRARPESATLFLQIRNDASSRL